MSEILLVKGNDTLSGLRKLGKVLFWHPDRKRKVTRCIVHSHCQRFRSTYILYGLKYMDMCIILC